MGKKQATAEKSLPVSVAMGALTSILLMLCLSAVLAAMLLGESIGTSATGYGVLLVLGLSSFLGSLVASVAYGKKRLIISVSAAGVYFVSLLCMTALIFGGQYKGVFATSLVILGGGTVNGLLLPGKGSATKVKRKKIRYS